MSFLKNRNYLLLLLIVSVGLLVRLLYIDKVPPSLNWDEVSHGYNAFSILKSGKDEWGETLPTIFRAYGDYKLPVYIYVTAISESVFGLNEFAVRLPSALAGTLLIIATYLLTRELLALKRSSYRYEPLLASLLVALEPWSLFTSRGAFEACLASLLIASGVLFSLLSLKKHSWALILAVTSFGLSVWTYNSARIFVPLLILSTLFVFRSEFRKLFEANKKVFLASAFILSVFLLPMFVQLISPSGQARFGWVQIIDEGAVAQISDARNSANLPHIVERLLYNRPVYFIRSFASNYATYLLPDFLFMKGGTQHQFSVPGFGLLSLVNLPLFYFGIYLLLKRRKEKWSQLAILWILFSLIPGSVTKDAPHVLRSLAILPVPMIVIAFAAKNVFKNRKLVYIPYILLLAFSAFVYLSNMFFVYPTKYSNAWQYGHKEVSSYIAEKYDIYENIIITKKYGEPHEFLLFYLNWDPTNYRNDPNLRRFTQTNWWWVDSFDKFVFVNDWQLPTEGESFITESKHVVGCHEKKCLLITGPELNISGWSQIETVSDLEGKPVFKLYEN